MCMWGDNRWGDNKLTYYELSDINWCSTRLVKVRVDVVMTLITETVEQYTYFITEMRRGFNGTNSLLIDRYIDK